MPCCLLVGGECKSSMDSGIRPDRAEDAEEGKIAAAWSHLPAQMLLSPRGILLQWLSLNSSQASSQSAATMQNLIPGAAGRDPGESPKCL